MNNNKSTHVLSFVLGVIFITGIGLFWNYYATRGLGYMILNVSTVIALFIIPLYNLTKLNTYLIFICLSCFGVLGIFNILYFIFLLLSIGEWNNLIGIVVNLSIITTIYFEIKLMYSKQTMQR